MQTGTRRSVLAVGLTVASFFGVQGASGADWDHVHLMATDTAAAARWYAKHFGSKATKAGVFDAVVYGKTTMKFKESKPGFKGTEGSTVDHIGFSVPDVRAKIEELKRAGVEIVQPVRRSERGGFDYGFVRDPWGTKIEVIGDKDLQGFHHVHLLVADREASAKWYSDTFGGKVVRFKDLPSLPAIRYGDMWLVLSQTREERAGTDNRAIDHIGWKVSDLDALVQRVESRGVKILVRPRRAGNVKLAFIEGPGQVKIEVQQVLRD